MFHPCPGADHDPCHDDIPYSWTEPYFHASPAANHAYANFSHCWYAVPDDVPDSAFPDGEIAANAMRQLDNLTRGDAPFFLAMGLHRPHLPWVCPRRFFDLYPNVTLAPFNLPPVNWGAAKQWAWDPQSGPRHMQDIAAMDLPLPYGLIPNATALDMRRAYFACTSFADDLVGQLLRKLADSTAANDTIVVFLGDHGWQLGDHGMFGKKTDFTEAIRAPLVVKLPPSLLPAEAVGSAIATPGEVAVVDDLVGVCVLCTICAATKS